jgi:hypothetical protein
MNELRVVLACQDAEESPILVDAALMRLCSSCAGGLPAEAATWDISNLVIDGQPVQRSTVIAWLDTCYVIMYDRRPVTGRMRSQNSTDSQW